MGEDAPDIGEVAGNDSEDPLVHDIEMDVAGISEDEDDRESRPRMWRRAGKIGHRSLAFNSDRCQTRSATRAKHETVQEPEDAENTSEVRMSRQKCHQSRSPLQGCHNSV